MKRILVLAALILAIVSCNLDGYTEYSITSASTFEYDAAYYADSLYLTSYFYGGDSNNSIIFNSNREASGKEMTGGFGLTMKRDSSLVIAEDNLYPQYTMYATSAARGTKGCAVFYQNPDESAMPEHDIIFTYGQTEDCTCNPSYCMINNTQLTVYSVLSDESDYKFEYGDYLKLKITGVKSGANTGSVEFYLADHRGSEEKIDSVLTSWKTISLSKLGDIDYVDFTLESSKEDFPASFCMDNFVATVYIKY